MTTQRLDEQIELLPAGLVAGLFVWDDEDRDFRNATKEELEVVGWRHDGT